MTTVYKEIDINLLEYNLTDKRKPQYQIKRVNQNYTQLYSQLQNYSHLINGWISALVTR